MYATVSNSPADQIQLTCNPTGSGSLYCSYITNSGALMTAFHAISGGGPYTLLPTPAAAGDTNQVRAISIVGTPSASLSVLITYQDPLSGTETLLNITLLPGYTLTYTADGSGWVVLDANGVRQG